MDCFEVRDPFLTLTYLLLSNLSLMNSKFLLSVLAAAVIGFLGGWLVWGMALMGYYEAHTTAGALALQKEEMEWWAIILAQIVYGILLTWVLWKTNSRTATKGARTAAILVGLFTLGMNLFFHATMDMMTDLSILIVDVIVNAAFAAIVGAVVGWILGRGSTEMA
jgi:hypothetical protein